MRILLPATIIAVALGNSACASSATPPACDPAASPTACVPAPGAESGAEPAIPGKPPPPTPTDDPSVFKPPPTGDADIVEQPPQTGSRTPVIKPPENPAPNPPPNTGPDRVKPREIGGAGPESHEIRLRLD